MRSADYPLRWTGARRLKFHETELCGILKVGTKMPVSKSSITGVHFVLVTVQHVIDLRLSEFWLFQVFWFVRVYWFVEYSGLFEYMVC